MEFISIKVTRIAATNQEQLRIIKGVEFNQVGTYGNSTIKSLYT